MPVVMETPIAFDAPPHKLWTREECEALGRAGVLELERYELICGEVVLKMSRSQPQMLAKALLAGWLQSVYGGLRVLSEPSIELHSEDNPTNDPVPDLIVLNRSVRELSALPRPEELWLVTEVSDTSLEFDLQLKARLYARAGIAEYWVVDLNGRRVFIHRRPEGGRYLDVARYSENDMVATLGAPEVSIRVGDLF